LVLQLKSRAVKALLSAGVDANTAALARVAHKFDPLSREVERLSRFTEPNKIYAYCFCGAE
jgi:hypothetical protein